MASWRISSCISTVALPFPFPPPLPLPLLLLRLRRYNRIYLSQSLFGKASVIGGGLILIGLNGQLYSQYLDLQMHLALLLLWHGKGDGMCIHFIEVRFGISRSLG
jgi:hypothetical protein